MPLRSHNGFTAVSLILLGVIGCNQSVSPTTKPTTSGNGTSSTGNRTDSTAAAGSASADTTVTDRSTPDGKADSPVEARLVDYDGYRGVVAKHAGKVVVVDAWATWCAPCVKNFPHLVQLHRKQAARGVACISLSLDYLGDPNSPPDAKMPAIVEFLTKQGAAFDNLVSTESLSDLAVDEKLGVSQIPAVFVFDRTGKKVRTLTPDADMPPDRMYAEVDRLVEELLSE